MKFQYPLVFFWCLMIWSCSEEPQKLIFEDLDLDITQNIESVAIIEDKLIAIGGIVFNEGVAVEFNSQDWKIYPLDNKQLFGIDCYEDKCIAVGHDGFYYTYDQIEGWAYYRLGLWDFQRDVVITSTGSVSVGGKSFIKGMIYHINAEHSIDVDIQLEAELASVALTGDSILVAVGYGLVMRSDDTGYTWNQIQQEGDFYSDIDFVDDTHGIVVGLSGSILLTNDAGLTWNTVHKPSSISGARPSFRAVKYIDAHTIYIVGDAGLLWISEDEGHTWKEYQVNTKVNLNDVIEYKDSIYIIGDHGYIGKRSF